MGLLKGNKIRYTGAEAIIGDTVITPMEAEEATVIVPQADPDEGQGPIDLGMGESDMDFAEPEPQALPLVEYEEARDRLIEGAVEASQRDAAPFGEQLQEAAGVLMTERIESAHAAVLEEEPEADFEPVMPYVQRQVVAELDLELVGTVNELRWTHLQRIEKKIVDEAETAAHELENEHPPETFAQLLAARERILSDARLEAERLVLEAQTRASEVVMQAERASADAMAELEAKRRRIVEELTEQARQDGYNDGKAAGEAEAAVFVQDALLKLNEIMIAFPNAVKQNEEKLVALAIEIARKVIQEEIGLQPEIVQRTVETALKRVSDLEQVTVRVNPLDLDLILPKQDQFKQFVPDVQNFYIEGNHTIARGGCVIETNSGSINATIDTQLSIIEQIFRDVRAEYEDELLSEINGE